LLGALERINVADFINEVEEELRKDEYNKLLKKWGPFLLGIIAAIIAVAGYFEWQKSTADKAARATSAAYVEANNFASEGEVDKAYGQFLEVADKAPGGYAGLSLVRAASLKLEEGDRAEAVRLFDQAAQKFETVRHVQLAQLKAAYVLASEGRYDDVSARLGPLAEKDQPYEYLARELLGFTAMQNGDEPGARQQFSYLATIPGVPPTIQERAEEIMSLIKVDSATAANDAPEPAPTVNEGQEPENE